MIIILRQTFRELFHERTRVLLTIFAIAWGTFTIATMLAIGEGLRINFANTVANSGHNILTVTGMSTSKAYQGVPQNTPIRLTRDDLRLIETSVKNVEQASPLYSAQRKITFHDKESNANIYGVSSSYGSIAQISTMGRFISPLDISERKSVIVLGTETKKQLFPVEENPVGQRVFIKQQPFTVIGVMREKPQMIAENMPDAYLNWIPSTAYELIANPNYLSMIAVTYQNPKLLAITKQQIRQVIALHHHVSPTDESIIDFDELATRQQKINDFFFGMEMFLGIVGSLTLIIAGVGIANVTLSSIHKATQEIGTRMAMGAKAYHIILQYTLEALTVTILGGIIGMLFSWGIVSLIRLIPLQGKLIDAIGKPKPVLSLTVLLIVISILGSVGFLAGFIPALRAAKIDPSEALRYE